jgi:hypothetical protein
MAMLVRFRPEIHKSPWSYRSAYSHSSGVVSVVMVISAGLFWETGMIGQVLYLEAEAYGIRSTGIGCYFDDLSHSYLGLKDNEYQVHHVLPCARRQQPIPTGRAGVVSFFDGRPCGRPSLAQSICLRSTHLLMTHTHVVLSVTTARADHSKNLSLL